MAIKFISVKCRECNASLPMEEGRKEMFCSYCGTKVIMYNENEYIYRHIDEASIKQAEAKQAIELKRIEYAEKKRNSKERRRRIKIIVSILLGIVSLASFALGFTVDEVFGLAIVGLVGVTVLAYMWIRELSGNVEDDDDDDFGEKIKVPHAAANYIGKSYSAAETLFRSAGFSNVTCIPMNDLKIGLVYRPNTVASITIGSQDISLAKRKYSSNTRIVIAYHSYA